MSATARSAPDRYVAPSRANVSCSISSVRSWSLLNFDGRRKSIVLDARRSARVERSARSPSAPRDGGEQRVDLGLREGVAAGHRRSPQSFLGGLADAAHRARRRSRRAPRSSGPMEPPMSLRAHGDARAVERRRASRCALRAPICITGARRRLAREHVRAAAEHGLQPRLRGAGRTTARSGAGTAVSANFAGAAPRASRRLRQHDVRRARRRRRRASISARPMHEPRPSETSTSPAVRRDRLLGHAHHVAGAAVMPARARASSVSTAASSGTNRNPKSQSAPSMLDRGLEEQHGVRVDGGHREHAVDDGAEHVDREQRRRRLEVEARSSCTSAVVYEPVRMLPISCRPSGPISRRRVGAEQAAERPRRRQREREQEARRRRRRRIGVRTAIDVGLERADPLGRLGQRRRARAAATSMSIGRADQLRERGGGVAGADVARSPGSPTARSSV